MHYWKVTIITKKTRFTILIDLTFSVVIPTLIVIYFLGKIIFGQGFIFYGDEIWPIYVYHGMLDSVFYSWDNGFPTSSSTLFYSLLVYFLIKLLGTYTANHLFVFLIPFVSGFAAYFSIKWSLKLYGYEGYIVQLSSLIGAVFYIANWQDPNLITPLYTWGFSYAISPLLVYLVLKIFKEHKINDMISFALISILGDSIPLWIITLGLFIIILLFLKLARKDRLISFSLGLKDTFFLIILSVIANSYFVVESIAGFLLGAGGQYAAYSSSSSSISVARGSSFLSFLDVFLFGQSKYYFFGLNPKNWTVLNFALPISIVLFLVAIFLMRSDPKLIKVKNVIIFKLKFKLKWIQLREIRQIPIAGLFLSLLVLLSLSLFLSKGFNPPFGNIYYIVILLSPPGIQGITRDVGPFLMISSLAYAFIFSIITLFTIRNLVFLNNLKENKKLIRSNVKKTIALFVVLVVLGTAMFATFQETSVSERYTESNFAPLYLPTAINSTVVYLNSLNAKGSIMWMPTGGTYPWKNNVTLTDFGGDLVQNSSSPLYIYNYLFKEKGTSLGIILDLSNTQYFVYNQNASFAFNYPVKINDSQILSLLSNQSDIELIHSSGGLYVYKNLAFGSKLYAGVPNIGNPVPNIFNVTSFVNGSNIYVANQNPYADLYCSGIINPLNIITNNIVSNISQKDVTIFKNELIQTDYIYNSSIFTVNNYSFSNGKLYLCLRYTIPDYLKNYEGDGTFNPSFSLEATLYKSTRNGPAYEFDNLSSRIYQAPGPSKQLLSNSSSGFVSFALPNINGNIAINYYMGSFQIASPAYYVGTLNQDIIHVNPIKTSIIDNKDPEFSNSENSTDPSFELIHSPTITSANGKVILYYDAYIDYPTMYIFNRLNISSIYSNLHVHIIPTTHTNSTEDILQGINKQSSPFFIEKNTSMVLYLNTPVNGTYHLNIGVAGNIYIRGLGSIEGKKSFNISINGTYKLNLFSLFNSSVSISVYQNNNNSGIIVDSKEINPVTYKAIIEWNGTVLIVLPEEYSHMWVLRYDGRQYFPISLYDGSATGFLLSSPHGKITIYFKMQSPLEYGYAITFSFVIAGLVEIFITRRYKK